MGVAGYPSESSSPDRSGMKSACERSQGARRRTTQHCRAPDLIAIRNGLTSPSWYNGETRDMRTLVRACAARVAQAPLPQSVGSREPDSERDMNR